MAPAADILFESVAVASTLPWYMVRFRIQGRDDLGRNADQGGGRHWGRDEAASACLAVGSYSDVLLPEENDDQQAAAGRPRTWPPAGRWNGQAWTVLTTGS